MSEKKRLLVVTDTYLPRKEGITRFLLEIVPRLKKDYEITILAPDFGNEKSKGEVVRLPSFSFQIADLRPPKFNFRKIRRYIKKADIVFVQSIGPLGATAIFNAMLMEKKVIAYIHCIDWEMVPKAISKKWLRKLVKVIVKIAARYLYNRCSLLIVPSVGTAETLNSNRIKTKKIVVRMGTNVSKFMPPKNKAESKISVGIKQNRTVIGYVGRLGREKDLVTLYRAFLRVQKKHQKAVLMIVGSGIEEIKKMFDKKKGVVMVGGVDNVVPYLQAMDIYVLPSLTETSSLSTMEAMSCGLGVVVTPVGYVKSYVVDGYNGLFFPKKNSYALSKNIERLIVNEKLRKKLGINARKTIVENFSWDKTVNKIRRILEKF